MRRFVFVALLAHAVTPPVFAQDVDHGDHGDESAEIVVTGALNRDRTELTSAVSVLTGPELDRNLRANIGDTLARQPGVSATSFGPNASRPILRGFQGERVRVLSDGIGSFDVSNTSADHAVIINPLTADRIEVLRGPSAMLYGSSAIGGVVNVVDSRIPRSRPEEGIHVDGLATYGSAANERSIGTRLDVALTGGLILHFDGTHAKSGNLRSGGFVLSPALRAQATASGDPDIIPRANMRGKIPNTAARNWELASGLAWVGDRANVGVSVTRTETLYGVPVRFATSPPLPGDAAPEQVRLDARQTRFDVRGEFSPGGTFVKSIRLRGGYADYAHDELDETGAIGTEFFNKGKELRAELIQQKRGGWEGAVGAQFMGRRFRVEGDEKFLPPATSNQFGVFAVQSLEKGPVRVEAGLRVERSRAHADADVGLGNPELIRQKTAISGSLGANFSFSKDWRLGLNATHAERAPSPEELFSNGPHAGTQAFEIGDPDLAKERSNGIELVFHGEASFFSLSAAAYASRFSNFVYEDQTGATIDGLPVLAYRQARATTRGFELEVDVRLARFGSTELNLDVMSDVTRTTIRSAGVSLPAPRIPAARLRGGLSADGTRFSARIEVERVRGKSRIAAFETATPAYNMVNASLSAHPFGKDGPITLIANADNIFDITARRHASLLKDYAPLAGRDIRLTLRFSF